MDTIKIQNFNNILTFGFVSDSPLKNILQDRLEKRLKNIYIDPDNLGLVFGIHFILDATTINNRHYLSETWLNLVENPDFQSNLALGKYVGCVGHDNRPVNDYDIRGKFISHVLKDMWVEDNLGFMLTAVKNNEAGKELRSNFKSGVFLKPSTRGRVLQQGATEMTPTNYIFLGVDYVNNPALPQTDIIYLDLINVEPIKEANESVENILSKEETDMAENQELLAEIRAQRDNLQIKLEQKEQEIKDLTNTIIDLKIELSKYQEKNTNFETSLNKIKADYDLVSEAYHNRLGKFNELESKYMALEKTLGTPDEILKKVKESWSEAAGPVDEPAVESEITPITLEQLKEKVSVAPTIEFAGKEFHALEILEDTPVDDTTISKDNFVLLDQNGELILMESDEYKNMIENIKI